MEPSASGRWLKEQQCIREAPAGLNEPIKRFRNSANRYAREGSRVDQEDAVMILLGVREAVRGLDEICHVEGYQHAALTSSLAEQVVIAEFL